MANHTTLPIYRAAYDLLDVVIDISKNMPRDFKQSIGGKLRDETVEIVTLIFRSNVSKDKSPYLNKLIERVQVCELLLRMSKDKRFISTGQYANAIKLTDNIGKQAVGWRNHSASSAS